MGGGIIRDFGGFMLAKEFWNEVGSKKVFDDPLYVERLKGHVGYEGLIVEYGCGYGRMLAKMREAGFKNLVGYDFAPKMIERGAREFPGLHLKVMEGGRIPEMSGSVDAVILSTVLCCIVDDREQAKVIGEVERILKPGGVLYVTDFLISDHPRYASPYATGLEEFGKWGIYKTRENLRVRHMTSQHVMQLLKHFDIQWFEQFDFKTMNGNPAKTFHLTALKKPSL